MVKSFGRQSRSVPFLLVALTAAACSAQPPDGGDGGPGATDPNVIDLAATYFSSCALLRDGTVKCWGASDTLTPPLIRVPEVTGLPAAARSLVAGGDRFCALLV